MHTNMHDHEVAAQTVTIDGFTLDHPQHLRFVNSCQSACFKPFIYDGRLCYVGPAIVVEQLTDIALLGTNVPLVWDHLGKGYVVHPKTSANECEDQRIEALKWFNRVMRG